MVALGLAGRATREQPHPSREGGRHFDDRLAHRNRLLGQLLTESVHALDCPPPLALVVGCGPSQLAEDLSVRVECDGDVRALVGSIPMMRSMQASRWTGPSRCRGRCGH
jgi:hypothetical protein